MLIVAAPLLLFSVLAWIDLPPLIQQRKERARELWLVVALFGIGLILSELYVLRVDLWSIDRMITNLVNMFR